jgi:hypothetical protein
MIASVPHWQTLKRNLPDVLLTGMQPREGAEILQACAHKEILCAQCLLGNAEGEYIVDPRTLNLIRSSAS